MITLRCLKCEVRLAVPDNYAGKRVRCDRCTSVVLVPGVPPGLSQPVELNEQPRSHAGSPLLRPPAPDPATYRPPPSAAEQWLDYLRASRFQVLVGCIVISAGTLWLLAEIFHFTVTWQWVWSGFLALSGAAILVGFGVNKQTLVIGPFLIIAAGFSVLRHYQLIAWRYEVPSLVIAFGVLLLMVAMLGYALPDLVDTDSPPSR